MRDITHQLQAAIANAIASGATREQVEKLAYEMRQAAAKEEEASLPDDQPPEAA